MEFTVSEVINGFSEDELLVFLGSNIVSILSTIVILVGCTFVISSLFEIYRCNRLRSHILKLEDRIDEFEGYYKFNPDGTVCKVSDLDINCSAVDIDKPTE